MDSIDPEHAPDIFDMVVNSPSRAAKAIQAVVGATPDGAIGPKTKEKMLSFKGDLGEEAKKVYFTSLAKDKAGTDNWTEHANGWANRYLGTDIFGEPRKKNSKVDLRNKSKNEILNIISKIG